MLMLLIFSQDGVPNSEIETHQLPSPKPPKKLNLESFCSNFFPNLFGT